MEGSFRSPLYEHAPDLFPKNVEICRWRGLFPESGRDRKGLVIHLAGTGDHTFFRREYGFCHELLESGYSAILVENPFYGSRKPQSKRFYYDISSIIYFRTIQFIIIECIRFICDGWKFNS